MTIKTPASYSTQTGIGSGTSAADRTIELRPWLPLSAMLVLTAGSPTTGALVQVTNSPYDDIEAGTANWVAPTGTSNVTVSTLLSSFGNSCQLTGIRAVATDGTWTLAIRQE